MNSAEPLRLDSPLLRSVIGAMPESTLIVDCSGDIVLANTAAENLLDVRLTGSRKPSIQEIHLFQKDGVTSFSAAELLSNNFGARRTFDVVSCAVSCASDFPGGIQLSVTPQALVGDDGRVCGSLLVFKKREPVPVTAAGSHEYGVLAEALPQIVFAANAAGQWEYANQRSASYTGFNLEALLGNGWQQIIHPGDRNRYLAAYLRCMESGEEFEAVCRFLCRHDGQYHWHLTRAVPLRGDSGSIRKWIGTCTDIHDQKNSAELTQSHQLWLQQVLDMMPMGVIFVEQGSGNIAFANRAAIQMAGGKLPLGEGDCTDDSGNPIGIADLPVARVSRGERLEGLQMTWTTSSGVRRMLIYSEILPAMFGEPSIGMILFQDVTLLKQAEAELQQKQEDLIRSNEDLQQFAYAVSHDLQEPLRMVSGYTQLIARRYKGKLDANADEYIQFTIEGADRMSQLIRDLLAFSRAGNPETRRLEQVDMGSVVDWALLNLQIAVNESGAVVTRGLLPAVTGDQARLAMAMQNLIGNAIKYHSAEPPQVHISASRDGETWVFCVADNGIGFDMKYVERVFGVFKRLHGKDVPGTGIGLAIAKKIVEIHKGRIWAESEPGKGSKFYFTIPVG